MSRKDSESVVSVYSVPAPSAECLSQRFLLQAGMSGHSTACKPAKKWCRKNPGYFHGEAYVKKVQAWRRKHPGVLEAEGEAEALRAAGCVTRSLNAQGFDHQGVKSLQELPFGGDCSNTVTEDVLIAQQSRLVGLAAMISGEAFTRGHPRGWLTTCYERGLTHRRHRAVDAATVRSSMERTEPIVPQTGGDGSPQFSLVRSPLSVTGTVQGRSTPATGACIYSWSP